MEFSQRKNYEQILTYNRGQRNFHVIFPYIFWMQRKKPKNKYKSFAFFRFVHFLQHISICEVQNLAACTTHKNQQQQNMLPRIFIFCKTVYWKDGLILRNVRLNSLNATNIDIDFFSSFCTLLCVPNWRIYDVFFSRFDSMFAFALMEH